jgi:hypothetical protein
MDNLPGSQNCHFLDILEDEIGPCGVSVHCGRKFNEMSNWSYLYGLLHDKVEDEIAARIAYAHNRLPKLFSKIQTDTKIIYPFKFDCITGKFIYPELESSFRKNIYKGNGKAHTTGFGVPIFGRLSNDLQITTHISTIRPRN